MTAIDNLLAAIRKHEAPKGYGQICLLAENALKKNRKVVPDVSKMRLVDILKDQKRWVAIQTGRLKSSAAGGYQFIRPTLQATIDEMNISLESIWESKLQDQMAMQLLRKRGLNKFLAGEISREVFANALAAEWASLPMVTGAKKGRSKYAGDGVNKSFHSVSFILSLLDDIKAEQQAKLMI